MKQKLFALLGALLTFSLLVFSLAGCQSKDGTSPTKEEGKLQVVTTIFPEYDWVRNILGEEEDHADLTMLLDNGVDLHSYQPTASDIAKIASCDVFVYVGGESDEWVEDALKEATNKDMVVVNLLETLGDRVKTEEVKEGMMPEEEEEDAEEEAELDEHVWLSLKNASFLVDKLNSALQEADPSHAEEYEANAKAYEAKLQDLDDQYQSVVDSAKRNTLLFGDRFPFRYLTDDYGLDYYAAFVGCSAETEASFETVTFLAEKVDELGLTNVLTIDGSDTRIAETIIKTAKSPNGAIRTLDSMQSTTSKDVADGETYLSAMEQNLEVLKLVLN